jgi:Thioesterase domain
LSRISTLEEVVSAPSINADRRCEISPARLDEHLKATVKRFKKLGIRGGDCVASVLPNGPDAATCRLALADFFANFASLDPGASRELYRSLLLEIDPKLVLMHPGDHPAREAARNLGVPVANVLRHFESGVFTLEGAPPASRARNHAVPLVLIAPGFAYRRLARRLDSHYPVIGITPPSLEHLPPPHTIEHVAAECVRMLRRYRPEGPYALAGWRAEGLVALEMARFLEEDGEKVTFVAMLDASELFFRPMGCIRRAVFDALGLLRQKYTPPCEFMAQALRMYRPRPWYGKIIYIRPSEPSNQFARDPWFQWNHIAPHGFASYEAPGEMFAEPNVHAVAEILAAELHF